MEDRRTFLKFVGASLASRAVFGANDRVQMGIIGLGTRGNQVHDAFMHNKDVTFVAACDVQKNRLSQFVQKNGGGKMTAIGDYRRILENKDVDAVLITTPDHWHSPILVEALSAGKDVYCEKPISNNLEPALKMLAAVRASKRIVQVGCQQRSWTHFQDWSKKVLAGYIGQINHCVLLYAGGPGFAPAQQETPQTPPADLDWEMFQGPAPRRPFVPSRLRWRQYWDYGGGSISDWGVHLTDVMLWYMNADRKPPVLTSAMWAYTSGQDESQRAPDTFSVVWKYDNFVVTFTNATPPSANPGMVMPEQYGNYFYGQKGVLLVNRFGYELRPIVPRQVQGVQPPTPLKAEKNIDPKEVYETPEYKNGSATVHHTRNFLDCVKSRDSRKLNCPMEIGFNSTLPTLLAVQAVRQKKSIAWDGKLAHPA